MWHPQVRSEIWGGLSHWIKPKFSHHMESEGIGWGGVSSQTEHNQHYSCQFPRLFVACLRAGIIFSSEGSPCPSLLCIGWSLLGTAQSSAPFPMGKKPDFAFSNKSHFLVMTMNYPMSKKLPEKRVLPDPGPRVQVAGVCWKSSRL